MLENSDGSAEWITLYENGKSESRFVCSVNGPLGVKTRDELPTLATLELVFRPAVGLPTIREALIQDQIYTVLRSVVMRKQYPRSLIQIVVQVLAAGEPQQHSVHEVAGGINVAVLALVDAGISLSGIAVAVSLAMVDGEIVLNPDAAALHKASSTHAIAFKYVGSGGSREETLVLCESLGSFTQHEFFECLEVAKDACGQVQQDMRTKIEATVEGKYKWAA